MKRILVPTDFSPTSERAFRFAVDIASRAAASVILYHIFTPLETSFAGTVKTREIYNTQSETNLLKRLQRLKKKVLTNTPDVPVSTVIGYSPIVDNILGFAEHNKTDLIVMGTQGASGLKKVFIGSTAVRIIERSDIPVLLVPENFKRKEPEHIVFSADTQYGGIKALTITLAMAKLFTATVTVVHLMDPFLTWEDRLKQTSEIEAYTKTLQNTFSDSNLHYQYLKAPSILQTMENLHTRIPHDMMVMIRGKKNAFERLFLDSFTKNMAYATTHPLLIIPEESKIE
ncbi:MAG: universal stress protein [Bacteroidetes bacterium]|nr:universal stress protein [Bacteroidota bacterium]